MSIKALEKYIAPLQRFFLLLGIHELCINSPNEIYVEKKCQFTLHKIEVLSYEYLVTLADLVAEYNHQEISPEKPLLSATLPGGERAQFVIPPACVR